MLVTGIRCMGLTASDDTPQIFKKNQKKKISLLSDAN